MMFNNPTFTAAQSRDRLKEHLHQLGGSLYINGASAEGPILAKRVTALSARLNAESFIVTVVRQGAIPAPAIPDMRRSACSVGPYHGFLCELEFDSVASQPFILGELLSNSSLVVVTTQAGGTPMIKELLEAIDNLSVPQADGRSLEAGIEASGSLRIPIDAWATTDELLVELAGRHEFLALAELSCLWRQAYQLNGVIRKQLLATQARMEIGDQLRRWRIRVAAQREADRLAAENLRRAERIAELEQTFGVTYERLERIRRDYVGEDSLFRDRVYARASHALGFEVKKIAEADLEFESDIGATIDWRSFSSRPKFAPGSLPGHVYLSSIAFERLRTTGRSIATDAAEDVLERFSHAFDAVAPESLPRPARVNVGKLIEQAKSASAQIAGPVGRSAYTKKSIWSHLMSIRGLMMGILGIVSLTNLGSRFGYGNVWSKVPRDLQVFTFYTLLAIIAVVAWLNERESKKRDLGATLKFLQSAQVAALDISTKEVLRFITSIEGGVSALVERYKMELDHQKACLRKPLDARVPPPVAPNPGTENAGHRTRVADEAKRLSNFKSDEEQIRTTFGRLKSALKAHPSRSSAAAPTRSPSI